MTQFLPRDVLPPAADGDSPESVGPGRRDPHIRYSPRGHEPGGGQLLIKTDGDSDAGEFESATWHDIGDGISVILRPSGTILGIEIHEIWSLSYEISGMFAPDAPRRGVLRLVADPGVPPAPG